MAGLDELLNQIPTQEIAAKLGADEGEVNSAVQQLVPLLLGGVQQTAQDHPDTAAGLESEAADHAASGLLDGGVTVDQVNQDQGADAIAKIFGGNDSGQVASVLAGGGAGNSDLIQKLLPILAPIVLAYIGKQLGGGGASTPAASGGGLGDVLGNILGGALGGNNAGGNTNSSDNPLGSILGSVLGGGGNQGAGGVLGSVLGGLFGNKK
ncbi:hypothetical protein EB75_17360 [Mycobacterium sp. ST-F2]|uniref:DUF937 domain-containing protein n=1 Tax=Mycobacterium sp. ST-F2 TaxID=1490484 RepID=UPI00093F1279|nr:DUF937 domain-containing protein [Mycobacterium sp. ST-F2]OKH81245.1 hypothetical protein EB75_17360 [Mycobacterium sp. ST-F2]